MAERVGGHLPFITLAYGMGTVLVVFGHSHPLHCDYPILLERIINFVYVFHMPLFFMIAGILIRNNRSARPNIMTWWLKKVRKLIVPYLVLTLAAVIPKFMLGSIMNDDMELSVANILKIIFMPRHSIWGHFWFIPVFLFLELIGMGFNQLERGLEERGKFVLVHVIELVGASIGIYLTCCPIEIEWFGVSDICKELVYVLIGIFTCKYFIERGVFDSLNKTMIAISLILSIIFFVNFKGILWEKAISFLMIYFIIGLSIILCQLCENAINTMLKVIGTRAFTIYIYSWPIQAVVEIVLVLKLNMPWQVVTSVLFVCGLFGPIIIYEVGSNLLQNSKFISVMIGKSR